MLTKHNWGKQILTVREQCIWASRNTDVCILYHLKLVILDPHEYWPRHMTVWEIDTVSTMEGLLVIEEKK